MKKNTFVLASLALVLVLGAAIGSASAYFTTYAEAKGGYTVEYGQETVEWFSDWTKHISVQNKATASSPVFVRARAVWSSEYTVSYSATFAAWRKNTGSGRPHLRCTGECNGR